MHRPTPTTKEKECTPKTTQRRDKHEAQGDDARGPQCESLASCAHDVTLTTQLDTRAGQTADAHEIKETEGNGRDGNQASSPPTSQLTY